MEELRNVVDLKVSSPRDMVCTYLYGNSSMDHERLPEELVFYKNRALARLRRLVNQPLTWGLVTGSAGVSPEGLVTFVKEWGRYIT